MKKFISLIALVGVFAACEPENLQTAFNVANATATVNATVVCAAPDFDEDDATVSYEWHFGFGSEAKVQTTQSIEGTPDIPAGFVIVKAAYAGAEAETTVSFPQVFAGMDAVLSATVVLPYNAGGYNLVVDYGEPEVDTFVYGIEASEHGHDYKNAQTVTFDGNQYKVYMMQNATEFILEDSYTWETYEGFETAGFTVLNEDFRELSVIIYAMMAAQEGIEVTENTYEFSVGAWSLYNVINPVMAITTPCYIIAEPEPGSGNPEIGAVAEFTILEYASACGVREMAHPDHASHYIPHAGHYTHDGHALHGNNNNAGGGIISAE